MRHSHISPAMPALLVFGSQILSFDRKAAQQLRGIITSTPALSWTIDVAAELPALWDVVAKAVPALQNTAGKELLGELSVWIRTGTFPRASFPLPNVILTPLVVIYHLAQYSQFLEASRVDGVAQPLGGQAETVGLCTGLLSAAAAACSSSQEELERYGKVAVGLAMLVGAVVDADNAKDESVSLSVSWSPSQPELRDQLSDILRRYQGTYVSVLQDQTRVTVTASKTVATKLRDDLKHAGLNVTEISLQCRFHTSAHRETLQRLLKLCDSLPGLHFPETARFVMPRRAGASGKLHHEILMSILVEQSDWVTIFKKLQDTTLSDTQCEVFGFGPESCVPPSLIRNLESRYTHLTQPEVTGAGLAAKLLGFDGPVEYRERLLKTGIAIIGMSGQLPGASDLDEFWEVMNAGKSQHVEVPPERFTFETVFRELDTRKWYGNFLKDYNTFDHKFFKKSPREMASTDPQHRVMLQAAYQAVEQSGYFNKPKKDRDNHIGVYIGLGLVDYERNISCSPANAYSVTGNVRAFSAGKISHTFGWTGPGLSIDTACSSSSVAIHTACQSILSGECSGGALAGGVNIVTSPEWYQNLAGASFLSPTGQCKSFDAKGDGYCRAEAVGAVFLKKLSAAVADGDRILGVIAGSAVWQNQNCTPITVPNAPSLSGLFGDVIGRAGLEPKNITYVEAHGTGTPVGDPAEFAGIRKVLGGSACTRSTTLSVGSVKGLIGHTESASGMASLLKILLMLDRKGLPPQASFETMNPSIEVTPDDKMEILTSPKQWDVNFRAALINNYGASGANACMVVTQAPRRLHQKPAGNKLQGNAISYPFWFTGNDENSLRRYIARFRKFLGAPTTATPSLASLSFELARQSNRTLPTSLLLASSSIEDLERKLSSYETGASSKDVAASSQKSSRPVILCFGGQISNFIGLDRSVYEGASVFRAHLDRCDEVCRTIGLGGIYPQVFQTSPMDDIVKLQTALFAVQYSCAMSWIDCGLQPAAVVGFSFGELTGLCVSGVLSLEAAVALVAGRARLIQEKWGADPGGMTAVEGDRALIEKLLAAVAAKEKGVSIACYNGPTSFTLAGPSKAMDAVTQAISQNSEFSSIRHKRLSVTHAFHSTLVDALIPDLGKLGEGLVFNKAEIPVERATEIAASTDALGPSFVADHMRNPVCFSQAAKRLAAKYEGCVWLEAGFNSTITSIAARTAKGEKGTHHFQSINLAGDNAIQQLSDATLSLWKEGIDVSFWSHHASQSGDYDFRVLPPYQFEKAVHWMELKAPPKPTIIAAPETARESAVQERPTGFWSFARYQDSDQRSATFTLNMTSEVFETHIRGHIIVQTAPLCPSPLQLHIVVEALLSLPSNAGLQPRSRDMVSHAPLWLDPSRIVLLDVESHDKDRHVWAWKITSASSNGTGKVTHVTGTIVFTPNDSSLHNEFAHYERLVSHDRCQALLADTDPDEVVKGPTKIYRRFTHVVEYGPMYKHVEKLVGKGKESAGRVVKKSTPEDKKIWLDPGLADSFCQVAGVFVNTMTEVPEGDVYIANRIDQWIRLPDGAEKPESNAFEVLALHRHPTDKKYISDVFIFEPNTGKLVEIILGIHYERIPRAAMAKALSRLTPGGQAPKAAPTAVVNGHALTNGHGMANGINGTNGHPAVNGDTPHTNGINGNHEPAANIAPPAASPKEKSQTADISNRVRNILVDLAGLEPEEIKDDADLADLGIDSLMGMELAREIEITFKISLSNEELMELTDFRSLVVLVLKVLGIDDAEPEESIAVSEPPKANGAGHVNGAAQTNGINGVNGANGRASGLQVPVETILEAFAESKQATDEFIREYGLNGYMDQVLPKSTELCVAYLLDAFEKLGCPIRSAKAGDELPKIPYLPRHQQFVDWIYDLLEKEARIIDISNGKIVRTAISLPTKPAETLFKDAVRNSPDYKSDHDFTKLIGPELADCLTGKKDGVQLLFGTPEGREIATNWYSKSPVNIAFIKQMESLLRNFIVKLNLSQTSEPLRILEMGSGTGGTTSKMLPLLAALGVPVRYTVTDLSSSLVANLRKRFKGQFDFVDYKTVDIEGALPTDLLESQHIVFATNCVHATHSLEKSTSNIRKLLRPDGFMLMLEMTMQVPFVDLIFGPVEGWWLFDDGRRHALASPEIWNKALRSAGYAHVDWSDGHLPESAIQRVIVALASAPQRYERSPISPPESVPGSPGNSLNAADVETREAAINSYVAEYTRGFQAPTPSPSPKSPSTPAQHTVLVTGATGSLGSHLVAHLAALPIVKVVVCLNRLSSANDPLGRQLDAFRSRGTPLNPTAQAKLKVIETDSSKPALGLDSETYDQLVRDVSHIVHNAWSMSITRPVSAFVAQFRTMQNLIGLARDSAARRRSGDRVGFQFISSIATVGHYPLPSERTYVPEDPMPVSAVMATGYGEAKLVCERMLAATLSKHKDIFRASTVRIGQIGGSTITGYWNPVEHLAFLLKSAQTLRALPDLKGDLSWCPVDVVAGTLADLLLPNKDEDAYPVYHIENPTRQPWSVMIAMLARAYDIPYTADYIVSWDEWLQRVKRFPGSMEKDNPAARLVTFLEDHFIRMSCGRLVLNTENSRQHSATLRAQGAVDEVLLGKYVSAWKGMGFLN